MKSEILLYLNPLKYQYWHLCNMNHLLQRPAESFGVMETIPAYGQQQSGGHICWAAQVNIAVHFLWALFCYIWPILGSLSAYTRSNGSGATAAVLRPLHSWRSAWRGREAGECAARCWNWALDACRTVNFCIMLISVLFLISSADSE